MTNLTLPSRSGRFLTGHSCCGVSPWWRFDRITTPGSPMRETSLGSPESRASQAAGTPGGMAFINPEVGA